MAEAKITDGTLQCYDKLVAALPATLNQLHYAFPDAAEQSASASTPILFGGFMHLEAADDDDASESAQQQYHNLVLFQDVLQHLLYLSELRDADRFKYATQYDVEYELTDVFFRSMALRVYANAIRKICAPHGQRTRRETPNDAAFFASCCASCYIRGHQRASNLYGSRNARFSRN